MSGAPDAGRFPSAPRALRDPETLARRRALVDPSGPLALHAAALRGRALEVPDFDPVNGSASARLLFLLEKPGPMTSLGRTRRPGSGFVSPDNDDPTAEATFRFLQAAGVDRARVVIWNVIPWWNGSIHVTAAEHHAGLAELDRLLDLFPDLGGVVLVGARAGRAEAGVRSRGLPAFRSAHPSPQVRAANRALWDAIPSAWAEAARAAGAAA